MGVIPPVIQVDVPEEQGVLFPGSEITAIRVPYQCSEDYKAADGWKQCTEISEAAERSMILENVMTDDLEHRADAWLKKEIRITGKWIQ